MKDLKEWSFDFGVLFMVISFSTEIYWIDIVAYVLFSIYTISTTYLLWRYIKNGKIGLVYKKFLYDLFWITLGIVKLCTQWLNLHSPYQLFKYRYILKSFFSIIIQTFFLHCIDLFIQPLQFIYVGLLHACHGFVKSHRLVTIYSRGNGPERYIHFVGIP